MEGKPTWGRWMEEFPQAVGEVGGWLHPNPEMDGQVSRLLAEVLGEGRGRPITKSIF